MEQAIYGILESNGGGGDVDDDNDDGDNYLQSKLSCTVCILV
jgi:hypothetical protein